jgi:GT2 family glycosyltransferase
MSPTPRISVIIPTYNRASLLARAVNSALHQSAPPHEVIVVDDCSSDETPGVLEAFGDAIRVVRPDRNGERGAARNRGAAVASGDTLAFLDSDDEWMPTKLAAQMTHLASGDACVTGAEFRSASGRVLRRAAPRSDAARRIVLENTYPAALSSLALPAAVFHTLGGFAEDRDVQGAEDWLFLLKLVQAGRAIAVVPEPLIVYRIHGENSTADPWGQARAAWAVVEAAERESLLDGRELNRLQARTACKIARGFATYGHWRPALPWTVRSLRARSWREAPRAVVLIAASLGRGASRRLRKGRPAPAAE